MHHYAVVSIFALLAACGGATAHKQDKTALTARNLYPLQDGYVWSHEIDTGTGPPTLAISRAKAAGPSQIEVSTGTDPIRYELREQGIWNLSRDGWLLRDPIEPGASWESADGVTAKVVRAGFREESKAGRFGPCAEVVEQIADPPKTTRTTFCVNAGPVRIRSSMMLPSQGEVVVAAQLLGFARGDVF